MKFDKESRQTLVLLPDGELVSPWKFYRGEVGQEYSYCAKKGYKIKTKYVKAHGGSRAIPICYSNDKGSKSLKELLYGDSDYSALFKDVPKNQLSIDTTFFIDYVQPECTGPGAIQSFDWNNHNGDDFDEIPLDQGNYGICYAIAAASMAESVYNIKMNTPVGEGFTRLSPAFLAFMGQWIDDYTPYLYYAIRHCNLGLRQGYQYVPSQRLCKNGTVFFDDFPWDPDFENSSDTVFSNWGSQRCRFKTYAQVDATISAIKTALMTKGPLFTSMVYYLDDHTDYYGEILTGESGLPNGTNHCVVIVGWGYDASVSCEYWIVKNSYGIDWNGWDQKNGYMRVSTMDGRSINQNVYYVEYDSQRITGEDLAYYPQTLTNVPVGVYAVQYRPDPYSLFLGYNSSTQWTQGSVSSLSPRDDVNGHASLIFRCNFSNGGTYSYLDHDTLEYYQKLVWAGKPVTPYVTGYSTVQCYTPSWYHGYALSDSSLLTADDHSWSLSNGLSEIVSYSNPPRIYLQATQAGYHTLKYYAINDNGMDSVSYSIYCPTCYQNRMTVFPNPVSSDLYISIEESGNVKASDFIFELFDIETKKWKEKKTKDKNLVLSILDIPNGTYVLNVKAYVDGRILKETQQTILVSK